MAMQIFCNPQLLTEVREELKCAHHAAASAFGENEIAKMPILASVYAETLRFGVQIHIPRDAPQHQVLVGNTTVPQRSLLLMNTWLAHSDESTWNTQNGRWPFDVYWPQRFLIYPSDPLSGPCKRPAGSSEPSEQSNKVPKFSMEGLQGAWIPYGGKSMRSWSHDRHRYKALTTL
jgi:hypothetical protein